MGVIRWCAVKGATTRSERRLASAALDTDGTVYAPAAPTGNAGALMLEAMWEGQPVLMEWGLAYLPARWLADRTARRDPELSAAYRLLEVKVLAYFAGGGKEG